MVILYKTKVEYAEERGLYAVTPYRGCSHGCKYCYNRLIRRMKYNDWIHAEPRSFSIIKLSREIDRVKPKGVFISFGCDPYQPLEEKCKLTRAIIELLNRKRVPYWILTKSNLILRDAELFDSKLCMLGLSITTFDPSTEKYWEPNSTPNIKRLEALKTLKQLGFKTWVSLEPILDWTYPHIIREVAPYIDLIVIGKLNYFKPLKPMDWKKVKKKAEQICNEYGLNYIIKKELKSL